MTQPMTAAETVEALELLESTAEALATIKQQQKALAEEETALKNTLQTLLANPALKPWRKEPDIPSITVSAGNVRIQSRVAKRYNDDIIAMETALKEAKQLANDMGDYDVIGSTDSVVFTPAGL
jgi:hypothetical protein